MAKPPEVKSEIRNDLFKAALTYARRRPWEIISDQDLFAVRHPSSDETLYACVIGQAGISYGLLAYRGEEGYAFYRWVAESETKIDPDEYISRQNQISLNLVPKAELDKFDRGLVKEFGWKSAAAPGWPQFRTHRHYEPPWHVDDTEARLLTAALVCGVEFSEQVKDGPIPMERPSNQIPTYEISEPKNGDIFSAQLTLAWSEPPQYRPFPAKPLSIDEGRIVEILQQADRLGGVWEADVSPFSGVITGGDRPFIPLTFLLADQQSFFILDLKISDTIGEPHEIMAEGILGAIEKNRAKPSSILVKNGALAATLAPLAKALKIPISEAKNLRTISTIRHDMEKAFSR